MIPGLRKKALEELIEERLKFQEAKRTSVTISDDEVEKAFKGIAERNKMTADQFIAHRTAIYERLAKIQPDNSAPPTAILDQNVVIEAHALTS